MSRLIPFFLLTMLVAVTSAAERADFAALYAAHSDSVVTIDTFVLPGKFQTQKHQILTLCCDPLFGWMNSFAACWYDGESEHSIYNVC